MMKMEVFVANILIVFININNYDSLDVICCHFAY